MHQVRAVGLLETGVAQTTVAKKFGVHRTTVYHWWKHYCKGKRLLTRNILVGYVLRISSRQNRLHQSCLQKRAECEEIGDAVKMKGLPGVKVRRLINS